jgi:ATP synthase protein I
MAALVLVTQGTRAGLSAALGGSAAFIPAILYATRMLAVNSTDPKRMLAAMYRAEAFKIVGTAAIFGITFAFYRGVSVVWMFATYFAALLVYFAALLFDR